VLWTKKNKYEPKNQKENEKKVKIYPKLEIPLVGISFFSNKCKIETIPEILIQNKNN